MDVVIKDTIDVVRDEFTLLYAWWRQPYHTPLNSSVMSWKGDRRDISFGNDRTKYKRGIDEYIYREVDYKIFDRIAWSWYWDEKNTPPYLSI